MITFEDSVPQPTNGTWVYADNILDILVEGDDPPLAVNIDNLYQERGRIKADAKNRLDYARHMAKLHKLGALAATPDTTEIHPEIAECSKKLDQVSTAL
jgi:hypothetical protein